MFFRNPQSIEYLIVGLGNPGSKYWNTRHNVGYAALDALASDLGVQVTRVKFHGLIAQGTLAGHRVLLLKPTTYMNLSGRAVKEAAAFYKIPAERVIVFSDDISLDPGRIRIRKNGSAGGHNGLKSIIECLGTQEFPRIRIGVGAKPHPDYDLADWVLGTFSPAQRTEMDSVYHTAAQAAGVLITEGAEAAASRYNGVGKRQPAAKN